MLTQDELKNMRIEIATALEKVTRKYGVDFTLGNISYTNTYFTCKLTGQQHGKETPQERQYRLKSVVKNLPKLGSIVMYDNRLYKIVGWAIRAKYYPIMMIDTDGEEWKMPESCLKELKVMSDPEPLKEKELIY